MFRETLAQIQTISMLSPVPVRAVRAMLSRLLCNVKMCKRVLTRNLLDSLVKQRVGTREVQRGVSKMYRNKKNMRRQHRTINIVMKDKLSDSEDEVKKARIEFEKVTEEYRREVPQGTVVDSLFNEIMKRETERVWTEGKRKNIKKIEMLVKSKKNEIRKQTQYNRREDTKSVKYRDRELEEMQRESQHTNKNEPEVYGGAVISEKQKSVLSKEPGFMMFNRIDEIEVEVEIEKGIAKARYEMMSWGDDEGEEDDDEPRNRIQDEDPRTTLKYSNMRATQIPTVQRLHEPRQGKIKQETIIEGTKEKLLECVQEYKKTHCDRKGNIKKDNLSQEEKEGLKQVKKDVKDGKIVVFTTDKSGKFSVDTPQNYNVAVEQHSNKDEEIDEGRVKKIENVMNHHMKEFNKMFQVGSRQGHEDRIQGATTSTNTPAPPMYGLRKDHKQHDDKVKGPPVRPVCGASEAPNSKLSHFLSRVVNDYADSMGIETECRSSEEMRAAFEEFNEREESERKECGVISMDVKALYPSMEWNEIVKAVREMIETCEEQIEDVDWDEVGRYLAITMTKEEVEKEGLQKVIPKRKNGPDRKVTVAYLTNKTNENNWLKGRTPGKNQKKKMIGIAVAKGIKACMANHSYKVGDKTFLQKEGGPIGLELTGAVSRAFMWRWDRLYLEKARRAGVRIVTYERYVDDSNQIVVVPPKGAKYDVQKEEMVIDEDLRDIEEEEDARIARVLLDIANTVMPCITMEADWPSKNSKKKLPILDMEVWMSEGNILYSHYEKPMSCRSILNYQSAHSAICKKGVHTQEVIRRMLNCSRKLNWETETVPFINDYMMRMKEAGYDESYRKSVLTSAIGIYKKKEKEDEEGKRPMFRNKNWKKEERRKEKERKKKNWATKKGHIAPIFVPATPGGELAKKMRQITDKEAKHGIHFNIVEVGGKTMRSELQKSNPTAKPGCSKADCLACKEGRGKGGKCHKNNVNYEIVCMECPENSKHVYIGETSKNLYTRASQHINCRKQEESFMRKHEEEVHGGQEVEFRAKVTHSNTDCLSRQIREGVLIRRSHRPVMNSKTEWFQPPLFRIQSEVVRE